jgi:hypothetical protein
VRLKADLCVGDKLLASIAIRLTNSFAEPSWNAQSSSSATSGEK